MEQNLIPGLTVLSYSDIKNKYDQLNLIGNLNIFLPGGRTIHNFLENEDFRELCNSSNLFLTDERIASIDEVSSNWRSFNQRGMKVQQLVDRRGDDLLVKNFDKYYKAISDLKSFNLSIVSFGFDGHYAGHVVGSTISESILCFYETSLGLMRIGLGDAAWTRMDLIVLVFDTYEKMNALKLDPLKSFIQRYIDKIELLHI